MPAKDASSTPPASPPPGVSSLSITVPCYNEEENVERVVHDLRDTLGDLPLRLEIVIVDDGSRDRTGEIADRLRKKLPGLRVIHHVRNRGYGAALRSGLTSAEADIVGYIDGDGQFDARDFHLLLPLLGSYDIASAVRRRRRDPLGRRVISRLWAWLMRRSLGITVGDINSGLKLYRRRVFTGVELRSEGAFIDAEIFARAQRRGMTVKEVEVTHLPREGGRQTGANPLVILRAFRELWKLRSTL